MAITKAEIDALEAQINARLAPDNAQFKLTLHFAVDRVNDARNNPPITLAELEDIFDKVINQHITAILALNDGASFNIRCMTSHINMPCKVEKTTAANAKRAHTSIVMTIMRKQSFFSKDPIEFQV